jgi:hypothetical protein
MCIIITQKLTWAAALTATSLVAAGAKRLRVTVIVMGKKIVKATRRNPLKLPLLYVYPKLWTKSVP